MTPLSIRNRQANTLPVTNRTDDVICDVIDDPSAKNSQIFRNFKQLIPKSRFLTQIDVNDLNINFPHNVRIG